MPTASDPLLELDVLSLGNRVGGIARPVDRPAVFVRGALPGEKVLARVTSGKSRHLEAELVEVITPSAGRRTPFCPLHGTCGGCSLQHLDYSEQLLWKRKWVQKALGRFIEGPIDHVLPSPETLGHRNRVTFAASGGRPCLHAFRGEPLPVSDCPALCSSGRAVLGEILRTGIPEGAVSVAVRCSKHTGATFVEVEGSASHVPECWGPAHASGMGTRGTPLSERLLEWVFPIPPGGFFQVNTGAAEVLLSVVMDNAKGQRILDLYGGAGTFGVPLAARGAIVDSVETNEGSVKAGAAAAALNGVSGFRSIRESDHDYISKALSRRESFTTVILDPPRAGAGTRVMGMLGRLDVQRIVYVSCNPFTAARDIDTLLGGGFRLEKILPVDMFPHTDHVETVLVIERNLA